MLNWLFASRFYALVRKEINQILRDKQLIILLIFPPTIQLLIYGFALNPDIHYLKMGVVDYARSQESRELISAFTENRIFTLEKILSSEKELGQQVEQGKLTVGIVIPPELNRDLAKDKPSEIQVLIDGVDANTAGIANGYASQIVRQYSLKLAGQSLSPPIDTHVTFLYNPGLASSWFFVPGVIGLVLTLIGSIVSSIALVREKDTGTLEQLLMTPAEPWEILVSKIVPLFVLLMGDVFLALGIGSFVFGIPFQGSFFLFIVLSGLYLFVGIGIGIMLATVCQSQQQVVLTTFFINLPMVQLSGAIAPIETMPEFFYYLSWFNPLRHYVAIVRSILLKGIGLEALWMHVISLAIFAVVLLTISARQFRSQLS